MNYAQCFLCKNKDKLIPNSYPGVYELKCSCGLLVAQNKKALKVIGRPLELPNTQKNATAISTGYTPKFSPWKTGIMIGKWGNHWKMIWWYSGMDKIKCWTETMGILLRQMLRNLCSKKWKHSIDICRHFVLGDGFAFYFDQFENGFNQCGRNITF